MNNNYALAQMLGELLLEQNKTVTTAESCTGGGIAHAITEVEGASQWFEQGFVTYSNEAKMKALQVSPETLDEFGAVSDKTVEEMAIGALAAANANISISISGIAGPTGGTPEKPVGLVWFGIAHTNDKNDKSQREVITFKQNYIGERYAVREQAVKTALEKLIQCLVNSAPSI